MAESEDMAALVRQLYNQLHQEIVKTKNKIGTVTGKAGSKVTLTVEGTTMTLPYLNGYIPTLGDQVMIDTSIQNWCVLGSIALSAPGPMAAEIYQSNAQSIPTQTWTKVNVGTVDAGSDPYGICDTTNHRIIPGVLGYYKAEYGVSWTAGAVANGHSFVSVYKNGAVVPHSARGASWYAAGSLAVNGTGPGRSKTVQVTSATDYFEVWAYQSNTGSVSTYTDSYNASSLSLTFLRAS